MALQFQPGFFKPIHDAIFLGLEDELRLWEDILLPNEDWFRQQLEFVEECRDPFSWFEGPVEDVAELTSYGLFGASVVNNLLLSSFQQPRPGRECGLKDQLTPEKYELIWNQWLGFDALAFEERFHPFYHEIVAVEEAPEGEPVRVLEEHWPCLMLSRLLFSRAGVTVAAPPSAGLQKGVADCSTLYWCNYRSYRPTNCQSHGWGANSMWGTPFRCDFEWDDGFLYNFKSRSDPDAISLNNPEDRKNPEGACASSEVPEIDQAARIELVRHRCRTRLAPEQTDKELYPYKLSYFERQGEDT